MVNTFVPIQKGQGCHPYGSSRPCLHCLHNKDQQLAPRKPRCTSDPAGYLSVELPGGTLRFHHPAPCQIWRKRWKVLIVQCKSKSKLLVPVSQSIKITVLFTEIRCIVCSFLWREGGWISLITIGIPLKQFSRWIPTNHKVLNMLNTECYPLTLEFGYEYAESWMLSTNYRTTKHAISKQPLYCKAYKFGASGNFIAAKNILYQFSEKFQWLCILNKMGTK